MIYMARPTQVLMQFLEQQHGLKPRREFYLGRLAMALEIITVIKTLEDELVPMLALQRAETISVLQTLLQDCELAEQAMQWYEALNQWRQPNFVVDEAVSARASAGVTLQDALALAESTRVQHGTDQSSAPPSDVWDATPDEVVEAMHGESHGSESDTDGDLAEFLRWSRSRRGTLSE